MQTTIEDQLARGLLSGEIHDGQTVRFDRVGDGMGVTLQAVAEIPRSASGKFRAVISEVGR